MTYSTEFTSLSRTNVTIKADGTVTFHGIDHKRLTLKSVSRKGFVVNEKGGKHWAGRGEQAYSGSNVQAYVWETEPTVDAAGNLHAWALPVCETKTATEPADMVASLVRLLNA